MKKAQILVVDDEPGVRELVGDVLELEGYDVTIAVDGLDALAHMRKQKFDLFILDINMPKIDGLVLLEKVRSAGDITPALLLTARREKDDIHQGFRVGADDYVTKPFSKRELVARVKAQLRRTETIREELDKIKTSAPAQETLIFDDLIINTTRHDVTLAGETLAFKPQEYDLLLFFCEHKGQMLSREFILERVWGWDYIGDSRTVDVHVRWLRQKVEKDPANPTRIVTVRGGGYRFEG